MKLHKPIVFLFQSVTVGLAIAFLVLLWRLSCWITQEVVEFIEAACHCNAARTLNGPVSYADAVEIAAPAVVNIHSRKR